MRGRKLGLFGRTRLRRGRRIVQLSGALSIAFMGPAPSAAATLTNLDPEPFTFTVTERGERMEMTLRSGETVEFCFEGCFVVGPNGDRAALAGSEHMEVSRGRVREK